MLKKKPMVWKRYLIRWTLGHRHRSKISRGYILKTTFTSCHATMFVSFWGQTENLWHPTQHFQVPKMDWRQYQSNQWYQGGAAPWAIPTTNNIISTPRHVWRWFSLCMYSLQYLPLGKSMTFTNAALRTRRFEVSKQYPDMARSWWCLKTCHVNFPTLKRHFLPKSLQCYTVPKNGMNIFSCQHGTWFISQILDAYIDPQMTILQNIFLFQKVGKMKSSFFNSEGPIFETSNWAFWEAPKSHSWSFAPRSLPFAEARGVSLPNTNTWMSQEVSRWLVNWL